MSLGLKCRDVLVPDDNLLPVKKEQTIEKKVIANRTDRNSLDSISSLSDSSINEMPMRRQKRNATATAAREKILGTIDLRSLSRSLSPPEVSDPVYVIFGSIKCVQC